MNNETLHLDFITECNQAGICGGRKRTYFQACVRLRERGNQRAAEILEKYYPGE